MDPSLMKEMIQALGFTIVRASRDYAPGEVLSYSEEIFGQLLVVVGPMTQADRDACDAYVAQHGYFHRAPMVGYDRWYRVQAD